MDVEHAEPEMYVGDEYHVTTDEQLDAYIENYISEEGGVDLTLIIMIDYQLHHNDADYDGGLSFFDRLEASLTLYNYIVPWQLDDELYTVEELKDAIRDHPYPQQAYISALENSLNEDMIQSYGF